MDCHGLSWILAYPTGGVLSRGAATHSDWRTWATTERQLICIQPHRKTSEARSDLKVLATGLRLPQDPALWGHGPAV